MRKIGLFLVTAFLMFILHPIEVSASGSEEGSGESFVEHKDVTAPSLCVPGITEGQVFREDVCFSAEIFDANLTGGEAALKHIGVSGKTEDVTGRFLLDEERTANSYCAVFGNIAKERENDGIYILTLSGRDSAGHFADREVMFYVNRSGSVFESEDKGDLLITEYSPTPLKENSMQVVITLDGRAKPDVDYTFISQAKNGETPRNCWYRYDYVIAAANFKDAGIYKIGISSEDVSGKLSETEREKRVEKTMATEYDTAEESLTAPQAPLFLSPWKSLLLWVRKYRWYPIRLLR